METLAQQQLMLQRPSLSKMSEIDRKIAAILSKKNITPDERKDEYNKLLKEFFAARNDVLINGTQLQSPVLNTDDIKKNSHQAEIIKPIIIATNEDLKEPATKKIRTTTSDSEDVYYSAPPSPEEIIEPGAPLFTDATKKHTRQMIESALKNTPFIIYNPVEKTYYDSESKEIITKHVKNLIKKIENPDEDINLSPKAVNILNKLTPFFEHQSSLLNSIKNIQKKITPPFQYDPEENSEESLKKTFEPIVDWEKWDELKALQLQENLKRTRVQTNASKQTDTEPHPNVKKPPLQAVRRGRKRHAV